MKSYIPLLLASVAFKPSYQSPAPITQNLTHGELPHRILGGVSVVDTPIVRDALEFAREHSTDWIYNHIVRSWLFGTLILSHNETLRRSVDPEVQAVAAILHDLGWDQTPHSPFVSADKRFEVDGAISARNFIKNHKDGKHWDSHKVQLVWDAIALHTQPSISEFKEPDVKLVGNGVLTDFYGPQLGVERSEFDKVLAEFPFLNVHEEFNETAVWLCRTKPSTTYGELKEE